MTRRIDLNAVWLFKQVADAGSYAAASRATGLPKSTISQRLAALERDLGTALLRRSSRSLSLTEAGSLLLSHACELDDVSRRLENDFKEHRNGAAGVLRISSSNVLAQFVLSPLVPRFLHSHANAVINIEASNRLVDLIADGYDMALRGHLGPLIDSNLLQRVVARTPWALAASPRWVKAHGMPATLADLPLEQALCFSAASEYLPWRLQSGEEDVILHLRPRLVSDDMISLRDAAIAGAGVASLPRYVLADAMRSGQLVRILPGWSPLPSLISVLTMPRMQSSRLAQAFSAFLAEEVPRLVQG